MNTPVAARRYMGRSDALLPDIVDQAFAPWAGVVNPLNSATVAG